MSSERTKDDIRREIRAHRRLVTPSMRARASAVLCERLRARALEGPLAVYLASPRELDLTAFIADSLARGIRVVAPRWTGEDYALAVLRSLDRSDLREGPMHILEPRADERLAPSAVRTWIVPGLAFDGAGVRLGYGGGWYDRLLAAADPRAIRLGVGYAFQRLAALPCEAHDCRMTDLELVANTEGGQHG